MVLEILNDALPFSIPVGMVSFKPQHEYLVAIDSDGCVFDTMDLKHKECFIPAFIREYNLQAVANYARQAAEFVNLYSKNRGCNRFIGLLLQLSLLSERPEVLARGVQVSVPASLALWLRQAKSLGEPSLQAAIQESPDADLERALAWSRSVNASIAEMVHGVPPFPWARKTIDLLSGKADMIVCSATPTATLEAEWAEHGIASKVQKIFGQEAGSKKQILELAKHYAPGKVLMVGDAPGDRQAAEANGAAFFPICPTREDESWALLHNEGVDRFLTGRFSIDFQRTLNSAFDALLPDRPPWATDHD